jgi:TPP-dependent pyruvate/acetoin dehydrogenase alpha subunit
MFAEDKECFKKLLEGIEMGYDFTPPFIDGELKHIPEKLSQKWEKELMESFENSGLDRERIINIYGKMLIARFAEIRGYEMFFNGEVPGYFHSGAGQEAVSFGVIEALRPDDYITTTYRGHISYIAKGGKLEDMFSEILGKARGCCKGKGGSMYTIDFSKGFLYSSGIVSAPISVAVGIGQGIKLENEDKIAVTLLGDGATNEGQFHESLNLACVWELPVLFVIENNKWAITTHVERVMSTYNPSLRAVGHNIPTYIVDGMDLFEVYKVSRKIIDSIRSRQGPVVIEALTQRFHGHTRVDPAYGIYRSRDVTEWYKMSDPLIRIRLFLEHVGWLNAKELIEMDLKAKQEVEKAIKIAKEAPYPEVSEAYTDVYKDYIIER